MSYFPVRIHMYKSIFLSVLFTFSLIGCQNDSSDPYSLRTKASKAQRQFQNDLYVLVVSEHPEVKEVLSISRDLQIAYTQRSDMRYHFLCNNHPDRIHPETYDDILNFEWTKDDEKALSSNSDEYSNLIKKVEALNTKNQCHPDWPKARQLFQNKFNNDKRFHKLQDDLNTIMTEIDEELKKKRN